MRRAFTLIELLIVIAIIAILALIAIPNFIEAQTRAKVSRVHGDMRSLATAIEAYAVDHNRGPIGYAEWFHKNSQGDTSIKLIGNYWWPGLTTPIAYITTFPDDPFVLERFTYIDGSGASSTRKTTKYYHSDFTFAVNDPTPPPWCLECYGLGYSWAMRSPGPSKTIYAGIQVHDLLPNQLPHVYDPTNGTVSRGLIIRTSKGKFAGPGS